MVAGGGKRTDEGGARSREIHGIGECVASGANAEETTQRDDRCAPLVISWCEKKNRQRPALDSA